MSIQESASVHDGDLIKKLTVSNRELELFAMSVAHDLREPARNITRFAKLLKSSCLRKLSPAEHDMLERITRNTEKLNRMIQGALMECLPKEKRNDNQTDIDCLNVVSQVLESLSLLIDERKASVTVGDLPVIRGDEIQITRVFQNLLQNALKFCDHESPEIQIRTRIAGSVDEETQKKLDLNQKPADLFWIFEICDNGTGVSPQRQEHIFELFYRDATSVNGGGTGLGLWICRRLIEMNGGCISLQSVPGKGTSAFFTLPRC